MLGWVIGAIAAACVCSLASDSDSSSSSSRSSIRSSSRSYYSSNDYYRVTFNNHLSLLRDYDKVNRYAKRQGYRGAVDFFYYLADEHDSRFNHFARFLDKVRHIRNDIAHNGNAYDIDQGFLNKLEACVEICNEYDNLSYGRRLRLN